MKKNIYFNSLVVITFILICLGLLMVYSASFPYSFRIYNSITYFFKKQLIFTAIGITVMIIASKINYRIYKDIAYLILIICGISILLTYIPGIGKTVKGAHRWINLGVFNLQPSEFAKVFIVIFMAYLLEKKQDKLDSFSIGFLPFIVLPGLIMIGILFQPDFGTVMVIGLLIYIMMFIGGVKITYLITGIFAVIPILYYLIISSPYRKLRILAFLNPWENIKGAGYQISQSLISFGAGGFWGSGIGNSKQKLFYLPEAHTDYIFAILAEELGFLAICLVILLFLAFFILGIKISLKAKDKFGKLLGIGLSTLITIEAFINILMTMGLLPPKGIALPFFSYGGSSLISTLFAVGILLNIAKDIKE